MNPSYARIKLPLADAMARFALWVRLPELAPPKKLKSADAVREATEDGVWRGVVAVVVYECGGWTVFEDLTGHLASFSADHWCDFAGTDELVVAGYNDAVPYGQLVVVRTGQVVREFLDDRQDPLQNVNRGRLDFETATPVNDWVGAASFVDGDELVALPDTGFLWLFGAAT